MKKVFGTIEFISGIVMLFGLALTVGSMLSEAGCIFAAATAIALLVFFLVAIAEWFYDRGKKDALPTEEESE